MDSRGEKAVKQLIKLLIKRVPYLHNLWLKMELLDWEQRDRPIPTPHLIKQDILRKYAMQYDLKILIETGTYYGDMVEAMKNQFDRIYSIELSNKLFEEARKRFKSCRHIELTRMFHKLPINAESIPFRPPNARQGVTFA